VSESHDFDPEQIEERLGELRPLVSEYHRLQAAREVLAGLQGGSEGSGGEGAEDAPGPSTG
jgi:hypothetical protein